MNNCCCCNKNKLIIFEDTTTMNEFFWTQYEEWKKINSATEKLGAGEEHFYYRFVYGDIAPKQAYKIYTKYIEPHIIQEYINPENYGQVQLY